MIIEGTALETSFTLIFGAFGGPSSNMCIDL